MQTATQDTVAIPRQVLNMIAFYSATETSAQKWRETVQFLLEPYYHGRAAGGALRNVTPTSQDEGASWRTRQASNAANTKTRATQGTRTRTVRSGSRREQLISLIRSNPAGMKRAELLNAIGLKGDKSGEMSVSNALTTLIKSNVFHRIDGKYCPGPNMGATTQRQPLLADA
jgi:hypothetical protein